ncbi:MAG: malate dehydrogenase [Cyclobacteriaceae bacterium]
MKIAIVGTGHVGSTIAYTLLIRELGDELILINRNQQKAQGDAIDLRHTLAFTEKNRKISISTLENPAAADLYIICLSVPYEQHFSSRFQLAPGNYLLFADIIPRLKAKNPDAVYLIVSNPVDVMTYFAIELGQLKPEKVMGVGTLIDSARFRKSLSEQKGIHPDDIRAYILGEHGDTQFHATSIAYAGGEAITNEEEAASLIRESAVSGYEIVKGKGYSNFAVAMATELLVESIYNDSKRTIPVSTLIRGYLGEEDVCLSLPVVVGREGISRVLSPQLMGTERDAFCKSAEAVRQVIEKVKGQTSR